MSGSSLNIVKERKKKKKRKENQHLTGFLNKSFGMIF
jgi:hypothetical protein